MRPRPLTELGLGELRKIKLVVSDFDGTATDDSGRLGEKTLAALGLLRQCGIEIVIATGRSSAFGITAALYLPYIHGVICENGSVFYSSDNPERPLFLRGGLRSSSHLKELEAAFAHVRTIYPSLERAEDDSFRQTEIAIIRPPSLGKNDLERIESIVRDRGLGFTYSSIHMHIMAVDVNKWAMVRKIAPIFGIESPYEEVLTIGDSVNDKDLFHANNVHTSIGVAQVVQYSNVLEPDEMPAFVCSKKGVDGLFELASAVSVMISS